jgi:hypothetical protein
MPPITVTGPFIGVNQARESSEIDPREARDALNCMLDQGTIDCRLGYDSGATAPNGLPIEGTHDYRQSDGTRIFLVKAGDQLYRLDSSTYTAIGGAVLTSGNLAQFLTLNNRVYITHGGTPKVTDGTDLFDWQITKPSYAPDAVASGSVGDGLLSGDYDYKFVFYSSTWGQESPSSPSTDQTDTTAGLEITTTVTVDQQDVELSNFNTSVDSRVDKYRIFRRKVSNFESDWFFIDEVSSSTTTYVDRYPDNNVDYTDLAPLTFDPQFPDARFVATNAGTVFASGIDDEPNNIYFSPVNKTVLGNFFTVDDRVTGLLQFQGELVVFTQSSIWLVSGNSVSTLFPRRTIVDRGCLAPFSIVPVDNLIYFLSENGVYAYDLSRVFEVSRPAKAYWLTRNFSKDFKIKGVHDWKNSAVWWSYADGTSATNDSMLVYFYRNSAVLSKQSWVPWSIPNLQYCGLITDPVTNLRDIKLGFTSGQIATYGNGANDNGTAIEWFWRTGAQDIQTPTMKKRWHELSAEIVRQNRSDFINASILVDDNDNFEFIGSTQDVVNEIWRTRLARRAAQLSMKWSASLNGTHRLVSWTFFVERSARESRR